MFATIKRKLAIRRSPSEAGRMLGSEGRRQHKQRVRDMCDKMRRDLGLPAIDWGKW